MLSSGLLALLVYGVVALPALAYARRYRRLFTSDLCGPLLVLGLWLGLVAVGYGPQSLSNVVEVPLALIFSLCTLYVRVFVADRVSDRARLWSYVGVGTSLVFVLALRTVMPASPDR